MAKATSAYPLRLVGFFTPHQPVNYTGELLNEQTGEFYRPPSRTKQEFRDECDINNIIKAFKVTGIVTHLNAKAAQGAFLDLPADVDYQSALNSVIRAEEAFMALPSKVRDRFHNDPAAFLQFMENPANGDEMIALGIRPAKPPAAKPAEPAPAPAGEPPKQ